MISASDIHNAKVLIVDDQGGGNMLKILIVDDEERILKLYSAILMREGYEVLTASDAKKGFDLAVSAQPNLILLDVMMPSVTGGEAFENLSENASTKHIPVIFLTSIVKEEEVEAARGKIGGREYISKSTPIEKFVEKVKKALSGPMRKR
jgi:CheY-like chemotaxis protein